MELSGPISGRWFGTIKHYCFCIHRRMRKCPERYLIDRSKTGKNVFLLWMVSFTIVRQYAKKGGLKAERFELPYSGLWYGISVCD